MATSPAARAPERRPVEARRVPEPLGPRALRVGLRTTLLAPLGAAAWVALDSDEGPGLGSLLPLFLALVVVGAIVAILPWSRVLGTTAGRRILHAWAVLNVLLITLAGWATGGGGATLHLAYAMTIVFFAVVLSPNAQLAYLAFLLACDAAVLASSSFEPLPLLMLGGLGLLASFLSRELRRRIAAHDRARVASERRWAVVGSVSRLARDVTADEPRRVLQGVVEAIVSLGYETAAIHLPGAGAALEVVLPEAASTDPTRGIRTLPDRVRSHVLGDGHDLVVKVKDLERQAARGLRSSGVETLAAVPLVVGDRPEGVLLVGSADPDGVGPDELSTFAMLGANAALALGNARRDEERREVAARLADADAVRADVIARVSKEIRKPLAAVTETSRALRETFGNESRHRLIHRLVTSATALDVTLGGSLDLSLLEVERVELAPRELDLGDLVGRVLDRLAGLFEGREVRSNLPAGLIVEADEALLEEAVEHVLVTAATSSAPGKAVEVAVERTGDRTIVKVAGDGRIPAEQVARITQPFAEGGGAAGPWIRLALASKILELHGTALEVRSEPTQGTRVWFRLPGDRSAQPAIAGGAPAVAADGGRPVQLSLDDALLPAVAARAARIEPPPVEVEEEESRSTPLAAAALAATAASSLVVTGILPDMLRSPQPPTVASTDQADDEKKGSKEGGSKQKGERSEEAGASGGATTGGTDGGATGGGTSDPSEGSSTGGTGDGGTSGGASGGGGTDDGSGDGGTGDGGDGGTGDDSEDPPPPGQDGSPGKSDEAPGHNKSPSPSPSP